MLIIRLIQFLRKRTQGEKNVRKINGDGHLHATKRCSSKAPSPKYAISLSPLQYGENEKDSLTIRWRHCHRHKPICNTMHHARNPHQRRS